ncbi:MAG: DUF1349 domain-containing protein [Anaerolineae bacterium]|nr:DUF1349 domain-containing protein [Anaerolineae bacterium]
MQWYNEPPHWTARDGVLEVTTGPLTDFWRKTHYDFIRDNGHFYYQSVMGDFTGEVKVTGRYQELYDQAGLMVRLDSTTWLKCGIEYVNGVQQASAVVTRDYSDWSVAPLPQNPPSIWLRIVRRDVSVEVFYSLDGETYTLLRMAYLTSAGVDVGPMCASPDGNGFAVTFEGFTVTQPSMVSSAKV